MSVRILFLWDVARKDYGIGITIIRNKRNIPGTGKIIPVIIYFFPVIIFALSEGLFSRLEECCVFAG